LLRDVPDTHRARHRDRAVVGRDVAGDDLQKRRLARAVASDETHLVARGDAGGRRLEDRASLDPVGDVVEVQHNPEGIAGGRAAVTRGGRKLPHEGPEKEVRRRSRHQPETTGFKVSTSRRSCAAWSGTERCATNQSCTIWHTRAGGSRDSAVGFEKTLRSSS